MDQGGITLTERTINNLRDFIEATLNEFWNDHSEMRHVWHHLLGLRILQVQNDELNEQEYIEQWKEK